MADKLVNYAWFLAVVGFVAVAASPTPPPYIECVDSSDCGKDECCTIGLGRFTIPVCRQMLDVEDTCRPSHNPFSTNVVYPDGNAINLTNVYYNMCPCMGHLSCSSSGTCVDRADKLDNYIDQIEAFDYNNYD